MFIMTTRSWLALPNLECGLYPAVRESKQAKGNLVQFFALSMVSGLKHVLNGHDADSV